MTSPGVGFSLAVPGTMMPPADYRRHGLSMRNRLSPMRLGGALYAEQSE